MRGLLRIGFPHQTTKSSSTAKTILADSRHGMGSASKNAWIYHRAVRNHYCVGKRRPQYSARLNSSRSWSLRAANPRLKASPPKRRDPRGIFSHFPRGTKNLRRAERFLLRSARESPILVFVDMEIM